MHFMKYIAFTVYAKKFRKKIQPMKKKNGLPKKFVSITTIA